MSAQGPGSSQPVSATSATGSIYDLGYRRYDGPRLGRGYAVTALFRYSLRACFGLGRSGRAKLVPIGLAVLMLLPAIIGLGLVGLANQVGPGGGGAIPQPIRYETYYSSVAQLLFLFVAAQAPELLGRDQRFSVLPLYFSRALRRADYAIAKAAALISALLAVQLLPHVLLFAGRVLASNDVMKAIGDDLPSLPPIVIQASLAASLLAGLSLAIASFTPRRPYATASIIAVFLIPPIVTTLVGRFAGANLRSTIALLSPPDLLATTNLWLFNGYTGSRNGLPGEQALVAAVVIAIVALAVLVRRYLRIAA